MIPDLEIPEGDVERNQWSQNILDSVSRYSMGKRWNQIRYGYMDNFRKFLGDLELSDYEHIHSTLGKPKPMLFANYPLFEPLIQQQVGEYTSRPVPFGINRINKNAYSDKLHMESELASEKILEPIWARIEKEMGVKLPIEKKMQLIPPQFQGMPSKSIRDYIEVNVKYGLNYLYNTYKFGSQFSLNLYDIMINDDCFSKIDIIGNDPVIRHIPIQNAIFQYGEDNYIFDEVHNRSPFMGKDVWMTIDAAIARYGYRLLQKQREKLLQDQKGMLSDTTYMTFLNNQCDNGWIAYRKNDGGQFLLHVIDIEVKAINKKKFLNSPYTPDRDDIYESKDVTEIWELFKAGTQYGQPRRRKNQIPLKGNYFDNQFSYFGMLSRHSFFRKAWPVQMLWNTSWMTLEFLLNQSGGKAMRYATERKPDNYEYEDVAWMGKVLGLVVEQIRAGDIPGRSTASGEVDFGPSQSIQYIVAMIQLLKQTAAEMTGVSKARQGQSATTSANSSLQTSIVQSSYTTKPIYDVLTMHTQTGLQRCADLITFLWEGDETKSYIGGDGMPVVFKVAKDLGLQELGIYVDSAMQAAQEKEVILDLMRPLTATDPLMILEVVKVFNSESGAEAEQILELGISALRQNQQAMEQSKIQIGAAANELKKRELDMKEEELFIKKTVPVKVAETQKEASENVQLLKNEGEINATVLSERAALDRDMLNASNDEQLQQSQMQQEQEQPQESEAVPA